MPFFPWYLQTSTYVRTAIFFSSARTSRAHVRTALLSLVVILRRRSLPNVSLQQMALSWRQSLLASIAFHPDLVTESLSSCISAIEAAFSLISPQALSVSILAICSSSFAPTEFFAHNFFICTLVFRSYVQGVGHHEAGQR